MLKSNSINEMTGHQTEDFELAALVPSGERNETAIRRLSDTIRQTAFDLHRYLGTGYVEKVYENALKHRLETKGHTVIQQMPIAVYDEDGFKIGFYEADLVVDGKIILELKAVNKLTSIHEAQLINYLKATKVADGMLINFGSEKFEIMKKVWDRTSRALAALHSFDSRYEPKGI